MKKYALLTVAFNSGFLLKNLVHSLIKLNILNKFDVYVIDNSENPNYNDNLRICRHYKFKYIDNRCNQLKLNFEAKNRHTDYGGSDQHSQSIDYGLRLIPNEYVALLDTDTYVRIDFTNLFDLIKDKYSLGYIKYSKSKSCPAPRIHPCFQLFNNRLMKLNKVKFHYNKPTIKGLRDTGFDFYRLHKNKIVVLGEIKPYYFMNRELNKTDQFYHLISMSHNGLTDNENEQIYNNLITRLENDMTRIDIINSLIEKYNFRSFLEIGTFKGECYDGIKIHKKISVDPDPSTNSTYKVTSDEFFKTNTSKFDIIFIDGLHEHDQVYRDIQNSLKCLKKGGVIVMHDCHPLCERQQLHLFKAPVGSWTGDCWKAFVKARAELPYELYVMDYDWGCGIIDTNLEKISDTSLLPTDMEVMTYMDFVNNPDWMNFKSELQFKD